MPSTQLFIDGTLVDRNAVNVDLGRLVLYNLDGPDEFTFVAGFTRYPGPYRLGLPVRVDIDGVTRFSGRIAHRSEPWDDSSGLNLTYRCYGGKWLANLVPVRNPTRGTGEVLYNLSPTDPDYGSDDAGLTVGTIITRILTVPDTANDLVANGVTCFTTNGPFSTTNLPVLKSATVTDLLALTVVPNSPVTLSGSRIWNQIEAVLTEWMPVYSTLILPDGTIRVLDTRSLTPLTLTLGTDPIERPDLDYDTSDTFTRVVVRGNDWVEGRWLSLKDGSLEADWITGTNYASNAAAEADWNIKKFTEPENGRSDGTITNVGGTSVTIKPTSNLVSWPVNKWSKDKAVVTLENVIFANQLSYSETRRVTANTQLAQGGTSVLTLDYPLTQQQFQRYKMVGRGGKGSLTYCRLRIKDTYARGRIRRSFPIPYPMSSLAGTREVTTPVAFLLRNISGTDAEPYTEWPGFFQFWTDPTDNELKIVFDEPYVKAFTSEADLTTGGSAVKKPHDVRIFAPISLGPMEAIRPVTGFEGPAFTVDGIQRTLYVDMPDWKYKGDQAQLEAYAQILLDSVKQPVVTGTVRHLGYLTTAITTPGLQLNIAGAYTTGKESLGAVVRSVSLTWPTGGGLNWLVDMNISTRRQAWAGDRLYVPQDFLYGDWMGGVGAVSGDMAANATPMSGSPLDGGTGNGESFNVGISGMIQSRRNFGAGTSKDEPSKPATGVMTQNTGFNRKDQVEADQAAAAANAPVTGNRGPAPAPVTGNRGPAPAPVEGNRGPKPAPIEGNRSADNSPYHPDSEVKKRGKR